MADEWCAHCRRVIPSPPFSRTTAFAKFVRDHRCYICDAPLRTIGELPGTRQPNPASSADTHKPSSTYDSSREVEVNRFRFEYETLKAEVDKLRFEYEKHQRNIQALQTKIARLSRERQEMRDLDREWSKSDDYRSDAMHRVFSITDEISACEMQISMAEIALESTQLWLNEAERKLQRALRQEER